MYLTWRELAHLIQGMPEEQKDTDVTVFIKDPDSLGECPGFFCTTLVRRESPDILDNSEFTLTIED